MRRYVGSNMQRSMRKRGSGVRAIALSTLLLIVHILPTFLREKLFHVTSATTAGEIDYSSNESGGDKT